MVAIIGNKGSGKSALADVLALAGNAYCDPKYFSFLTKERFCERNGRIAKQFEVEATWEDGTKTVTPLNGKPDLNAVELVKYIPQTYLEKVCTETDTRRGRPRSRVVRSPFDCGPCRSRLLLQCSPVPVVNLIRLAGSGESGDAAVR